MKYKNRTPAILLLEDGTVYHGKAAGKVGTTSGEIAFNTGMTGYQEIFTDPSYYGQILLMTPSHIGNYGIHLGEVESGTVKIAGLVCKKFSDVFSRHSADEDIQHYFEKQGLVGISDVDTRAVVRHIRDKGAMNAIISSEELDVEKLKEMMKSVPSMEGLELSSRVATKEIFTYGNEQSPRKVAVLDFGTKNNILRCLAERDCYLRVFPMETPAREILAWQPDGIMLSNGPGDPAAMEGQVNRISELLQANIPTFGICLGHQLLALATGLHTHKMHTGHRGVNHPVKNLETGKCEVTSQNHGFVVAMEDIGKHDNVTVTHIHLNDNSVAGIRLKDKPAFSVQFHPESSAGPNDSRYLFDQFIQLMDEHKTKVSN